MTTNIITFLTCVLSTTNYTVKLPPQDMAFTNGALVVTSKVQVENTFWSDVATDYVVTEYGTNVFSNKVGDRVLRAWDTSKTNLYVPPTPAQQWPPIWTNAFGAIPITNGTPMPALMPPEARKLLEQLQHGVEGHGQRPTFDTTEHQFKPAASSSNEK